jgi:hypothetical protein
MVLSLSPEWRLPLYAQTREQTHEVGWAKLASKLTKSVGITLGISHNDRRVPAATIRKSVPEEFETLSAPFSWEQDANLLRTTCLGSSRVSP